MLTIVHRMCCVFRKPGRSLILLYFHSSIIINSFVICAITQGGGVGFYFKNNLRFKILPDKSIFINRVFESIFAKVWINNNKKVVIGNIYRPSVNHPTLSSSQQFDQFFELFSNLLNDFAASNTQVIIVGDFNLNALKYNLVNQVTEYIDLLFSFGFLQLIMKPTRCTPHSASLIDHVLTNTKSDLFETAILTSDISDHFPIIFFSKICSPGSLARQPGSLARARIIGK